jgi:phage terminase small subunit
MNKKQLAFSREYIISLNGSDAARKAGYSPHTSKEKACELLKRDDVQLAIQTAFDARAYRLELSADKVLQNIIDIEESARTKENYRDALKANELLGKHLKLFTDRQEIEHSGSAPVTIIDDIDDIVAIPENKQLK